jgi:hypothetical protein
MSLTLKGLGDSIGELLGLPVYENGLLPRGLAPFVYIQRKNTGAIPIIDRVVAVGGILVYSMGGQSKVTAYAVQNARSYFNIHCGMCDEHNKKDGSTYKGFIISNHISIVLYDTYKGIEEILIHNKLTPFEYIEAPKIYGLV